MARYHGLQALWVYTIKSGEPVELMRSNYVRYAVTDMDQDQTQELVVLRGVWKAAAWRIITTGRTEFSLNSTAGITVTMAELSQQGRVTGGMLPGWRAGPVYHRR